MTPRLRVLVVEDSLTVRRRLVEVLGSDPGIEVVGEAADGKRGIELCERLRPDVVTMDMMLPVMSGLSATEWIMAHVPTPILVVSSSLNRGELFKTYEALAAGAVDVLDKPTGDEPDGDWEARLLTTVKLVARIRVITHPRARLAELGRGLGDGRSGSHAVAVGGAGAITVPARPARRGYELLVIGASTGGPGAILEILRTLRTPFPLPILFVLHIGEPFALAFADWLDGQTGLRVRYAKDGDRVDGGVGQVVMAPPDRHLAIEGDRLRVHHGEMRHSCRPSVDVLFESAAREYGAATIAVLLTGMGRDGASGLLDIRRAGGLTIGQDEATSVVYGMPREAALIGAVDRQLPLPDIGPMLSALAMTADGRQP